MLVKAIINSIPRIAQEAGGRCVFPSQSTSCCVLVLEKPFSGPSTVQCLAHELIGAAKMLVKAIITSIPRIAQEAGDRCVFPSQSTRDHQMTSRKMT